MSLRLRWEWAPESAVRIPELAATWCRLSIDLDETPATLVERRDGSGGPRHGLDVAAYPLAEFLAINWWRLSATSHLPSDRGIRIVEAGAGFAWPDLTLQSDRGLVWAELRQRDKAPEHVRFLTQARTVFAAESVLLAAADFVDSTVRRLEDVGIAHTLLQDEWAAIQHADQSEREYCLVAAAWGQDPYDTPDDVAQLLLRAGAEIGSATLLVELSRAVPLVDVADSASWLQDATASLDPREIDLPAMGPLDWSSAAGIAPWKVGYDRARKLRRLLDLDPSSPAPIEGVLSVGETRSQAPVNVDGMISEEGASNLAVVVGAGTGPRAKRFAAARAIGRHSLAPGHRLSLLTRAARYADRAERAFAAELLAPAEGVAQVLAGDFSDEALRRAADHFSVNPVVVEHQVENQIAA